MVVMKFGLYNSISATYDGRHGDCNNIEFREYIENLIILSRMAESNGVQKRQVLNDERFSYNPFKPHDKIMQDIDCEAVGKQKRKAREFIDQNIEKWKFSIGEVESNTNNSKIGYFISYINSKGRLIRLSDRTVKYLGIDGKMIDDSQKNYAKRLMMRDKKRVIQLTDALRKFINIRLKEEGFHSIEDVTDVFSVELIRGQASPQHLFTKGEIEYEMRMADDRLGNVLVVDEDGYAHVIPIGGYTELYPVVIESWAQRKNYVGRYSSLNELENAYLMALEGWLEYLETNEAAYRDYTELTDDKEIREQIQRFY